MNKILFTLLANILIADMAIGQTSWRDMVNNPTDSTNYYDIVKQYCSERHIDYPASNKIDVQFIYSISKQSTGEDEGGQEDDEQEQFKRWSLFWLPRISAKGHFPAVGYNSKARDAYRRSINYHSLTDYEKSLNTVGCGEGTQPIWRPSVSPADSGVGRIDCIAVDPTNHNIIWAGSPTGGLWKSTNSGQTWNTNTDTLSDLGISTIAISRSNPSVMYIATGDRDSRRLSPNGIFKSTDGGLHWHICPCGSSLNTCPVQQDQLINQVLISPTSPDTLFVATTLGVYRSFDGGNTWSGIFMYYNVTNMVFQTNDASVIMGAVTNGNWGAFGVKIRNYGNTYTIDTAGFPYQNVQVKNTRIAVTPNDPAYVYMVTAGSLGFYGLYLSTDTGNTFTLQSDTPNIMDRNCTSPYNAGNQSWYDLALTVSPINKHVVYIGGINVWSSQNSGVTWQNIACNYTNIHADQHFFEWSPDGQTLYLANDGGLYKTTDNGNNWLKITGNMQTTEYFTVSSSFQRPDVFIAGSQDNGLNAYSQGTWKQTAPGDIYTSFMYEDDDSLYFCYIGIGFGGLWDGVYLPYGGPVISEPDSPSVLINCANGIFYKSHDRGHTWSAYSNPISRISNLVKGMCVSKQNENVFYVYTFGDSIFKANRITAQVQLIHPPAEVVNTSEHLGGIEKSDLDSNVIWAWYGSLIESGSSSSSTYSRLVFKSTDAGNTWVNISSGLPAVHASTFIHNQNTAGDLYLGTDIGVFYYNDAIGYWVYFSDSLPNVIINKLEIVYPFSILRAATFGRGVWQCNLPNVPVAGISPAIQTACAGQTVVWRDSSTNNPGVWQWSFPGGTPNTASNQNVSVSYMQPGVYDVSLRVANYAGCDSLTISGAITVDSTPYTIIIHSGDSLISSNQAFSYQWALNGSNIPGDTNRTHILSGSISQLGCYRCKVTGKSGCSFLSDSICLTNPLNIQDINGRHPDIFFYPNPVDEICNIRVNENSRVLTATLLDVTGREVLPLFAGKNISSFSFNTTALQSGVYFIRVTDENGKVGLYKLIKQ